MKKTFLAMILAAASGLAFADDDVKLSAQQQKDWSYLMGYEAATMFHPQLNTFMSLDKQEVFNGLQDALVNKTTRINEQQKSELEEALANKMIAYHAKIAQENLTQGEQFLAHNKTQAGIHTTASGLQYRVDKAGSGARVKLGDTVSVFYTGKLLDGTVFVDQSHGRPFTIELTRDNLIAGWVEGLQLMQKGGEYTLFVPTNLAYGEMPSAAIQPNSMLIFEIKVADIQAAPSKKKTSPKTKRR